MPMVLPLYHAANRGYQYKEGAIILQKLKETRLSRIRLYPLGHQRSQVHFFRVYDT